MWLYVCVELYILWTSITNSCSGTLSNGNLNETDREMTDEQRLLYRLMKSYDRSSRPVYRAATPVVIQLGISLTQVLDVDEKNQVLTTNVWLDQEWRDEKLVWTNVTGFEHIGMIRIPCDLIWLPDIVLYNSVDSHSKGYMRALAMVRHDGNVFWPPIVRMRSSCKMDITYFPFDDQICTLKLGSWAYDGIQVDVTNRTLEVDLANYVDNGEWTLVSSKVIRNVKYYPCCPVPFPDVTFYLHLRRRVLYYAFNVIIPCMLLSLLTLTGFLLPPDSGEKVTLGLTVLLAFSVFMLLIAENMPPTSEYIPLIGIYLTVIMAMSGLSVVFSVFVLNVHYKGTLSTGPPRLLKIFVRFIGRVLCMSIKFDNDFYNIYKCKSTSHGSFTNQNGNGYSSYRKSCLHENDLHSMNKRNDRNHVDSVNCVNDDPVSDVIMGHHLHRQYNQPINTTHLKSLDKEMVTYFKQVVSTYEQSIGEKQIVHEWQEIARVMDKLFFCMFTLVTLVSSFILLVASPMTKDIDLYS